MRCLACNKILSDYESTRKYAGTRRFVDLCNHCFNASDLTFGDVDDREDLRDLTDEVESDDDESDDR
jgi:hypothetical protein